MRGGNKVHARDNPNVILRALCGAYSQYGLTFSDMGGGLQINCKKCLKLIDEENARLRAGVT